MIDIVKGVLDGGWALLVGWLFPSALTVLLFGFLVYPSIEDVSPFNKFSSATAILTTAAVLGIVLSALQTPLYRMLEGYRWPRWPYNFGHNRHVKRRLWLRHTVNLAAYSDEKRQLQAAEGRYLKVQGSSDEESLKAAQRDVNTAEDRVKSLEPSSGAARDWLLGSSRKESRAKRRVAKAESLPLLRRQILAERLERYPRDEDQILPTMLGNAIRRFERFGPEHYGLDQQRLWYELTGLAPEAVSKQVGQARTAVDFFVSLMYGQMLIALLAAVTMAFDPERRAYLAFGVLAAVMIAIGAYRGAIAATDEWAYSVQALVNAGRGPLAKGLALKLPATLGEEQQMWRSVGRFLGPKPAAERLRALDKYRLTAPGKDSKERTVGH
jgi:hypothetical protein